jgi:5'(3')-deoxyribonucleotidase
MTKKYVIAVDVDDVVLNLVDILLEVYNNDYQDDLKREDISIWNIVPFVKPECGEKILAYFEDPSLYWAINPVKDSLEGVKFLRLLGHRIIFVTHSTIGAAGAKLKKLLELGYLTDQQDYIECADKSLVRANFIIDDKYETIKNFQGIGILYRQPWNAGDEHKFVVSNWKEIVNLFRIMSEKDGKS